MKLKKSLVFFENKSKPLRKQIWWRVVPQKNRIFCCEFPLVEQTIFAGSSTATEGTTICCQRLSWATCICALSKNDSRWWIKDMLMWFTPLWLFSKSSPHTQCCKYGLKFFVASQFFSSWWIPWIYLSTCDFSER